MSDVPLRKEQLEDLPTSKITSGTFADARISESSVTQHQAALSITESQISDLGSYQPLDSDLTTIAAANNGSVLAATTASFLTADETKLDGIEASADVTDTANVTAAGALMDSEVTNLAAVKAFDPTDYVAVTGDTMSGDLNMGDQDITGLGAVRFTQELDNGSKTASFSIDFSTDQHQEVTLTANTMTLTLDTTDIGVGVYTLKVINGGLATLSWASETGSVAWPGGSAPTLTSSGYDIVSCRWDGTNWQLVASLDFS